MKEVESKFLWGRFFVLIAALVVSGLLFIAAFGKIISADPRLGLIDPVAGYFEICIAALLLVYHPYGKVWALLGLMFSAWGGYALFWLVQGAPCSCLGKIAALPPGILFSLDALLFTVAAAIAHKSAPRRIFQWFIMISASLFVIGLAAGVVINHYIIEK